MYIIEVRVRNDWKDFRCLMNRLVFKVLIIVVIVFVVLDIFVGVSYMVVVSYLLVDWIFVFYVYLDVVIFGNWEEEMI